MKNIGIILLIMISFAVKAQQYTYQRAEKQVNFLFEEKEAQFVLDVNATQIVIQSNFVPVSGPISELDVLKMEFEVINHTENTFVVKQKNSVYPEPQDYTFTITLADGKVVVKSLNLENPQVYSFFN